MKANLSWVWQKTKQKQLMLNLNMSQPQKICKQQYCVITGIFGNTNTQSPANELIIFGVYLQSKISYKGTKLLYQSLSIIS